MSRRTDRAKLLEQVFADRMPHLEAVTAAADELARARQAVEEARRALTVAGENLRAKYDAATDAGWSDADLRVVGIERPRRPSTGRPPRTAAVPLSRERQAG